MKAAPLQNCPVCDDEVRISKHYTRFFVRCCHLQTLMHKSLHKAVRNWNQIVKDYTTPIFKE